MTDAEVLDGEPVDDHTHALTVRPAPTLAVTPQADAAELVARLDVIRDAMNTAMLEGIDYGRIPGVDKPSLFKPGAEKLGVLFQLDVQLKNGKTWGPGDHLTVSSEATVFHAPTGTRLGYGEGMCSTRESRYAKRRGERLCPQCGKPAIIKGKAEYGGGWVCFKKKDGCGAKYHDTDPAITGQVVGDIENPDLPDLWNCVTPETRVLTRDLRWVPAGDLKSGDVLISVAEENRDQYGRPYEDAVVTVGDSFTDDLYEITMEDGRIVRCNGEHRWLAKAVYGGVEWVSTETLYASETEKRMGRPRVWRILGVGTPWEREDSRKAGYVAGLLDADGSLDVGRYVNSQTQRKYTSVVVSFAQQHGGVLERLTAELESRRFEYSEYPHLNPQMRVPVVKVHVRGGLFEQMRLLGTVGPPRLLARWANLVDLSRRRFEGLPVQVASVERVGRGELVRLGTSSRTYIAEGLVCHNTVVKMSEKRARVDAVLAVTGASALFTQDVEDTVPADTSAPVSAPSPPVAPRLSDVTDAMPWDDPGPERPAFIGNAPVVEIGDSSDTMTAQAIMNEIRRRGGMNAQAFRELMARHGVTGVPSDLRSAEKRQAFLGSLDRGVRTRIGLELAGMGVQPDEAAA
jgi:hypothetical protein